MTSYQESCQAYAKTAPVENAETALMRRLQRPQGAIDVVLDTDTYNEIDDQYALAYLIANANKLRLKAIYAAPFSGGKNQAGPAEGMEKSYQEIQNIVHLIGRDDLMNLAFRGSTAYLDNEETPVYSEAARHLAELAMHYTPDHPLYVIAIAAITNVASALLLNPDIRDRIVIVWLGGNALHWHDNREYNLMQDIAAARVVLGSGAAVVLLPCLGVVSAFATTEPELRVHLKEKNALCDYLYESTVSYVSERNKGLCWSKAIWDVTAIGWLLDGEFMQDEIIQSPIPEYDHHWGQDKRRHLIRCVYHIHRDKLFSDLFQKLQKL